MFGASTGGAVSGDSEAGVRNSREDHCDTSSCVLSEVSAQVSLCLHCLLSHSCWKLCLLTVSDMQICFQLVCVFSPVKHRGPHPPHPMSKASWPGEAWRCRGSQPNPWVLSTSSTCVLNPLLLAWPLRTRVSTPVLSLPYHLFTPLLLCLSY